MLISLSTLISAEQIDNSDFVISDKLGTSFAWMPAGTFFYDAARFRDSDIKIIIRRLDN